MTKEMIFNTEMPENVRVAVLEDGTLQVFFEDTAEGTRTRGNIYLAKISRIEKSLNACFLDYGANKNGFLPLDEISPNYWDRNFKSQRPGATMAAAVRANQSLVVQVTKEPIGTKGARLTTFVSLAGRYLVLTPFSETRGVSRKIEDEEQRKKLRDIGAELTPPKGMGFILRTAVFDQPKHVLAKDMNFLIRLWNSIQSRAKAAAQPGLIHPEADLVYRVLRDYFSDDMRQLWFDEAVAMERARQFFKSFMPRQQQKVKPYVGKVPIFSEFGIEEQLEKIHNRKVDLPSGGSVVVDQTEALVAIDVNSGKMRQAANQELTAYETNLEAAKEIARQLRLRNLGGIVVIDFIDMISAEHRTAVEQALKDSMRSDKSHHQIAKISSFGLCVLTRERMDSSIRTVSYNECPTCKGNGEVRAADASAYRLLRRIRNKIVDGTIGQVRVRLHPNLANHIQNKFRQHLLHLEREKDVKVDIEGIPTLSWNDEEMETSARHTEQPESVPAKPAEMLANPFQQQPTAAPKPASPPPMGTGTQDANNSSSPNQESCNLPRRRKRRYRPHRGSRKKIETQN